MTKRDTKKIEIFQAALKVFAKYGYRRARIEDVADELGMRKGSLYLYIKSKKELYESAISYGLRNWQSAAMKESEKHNDPSDQLIAYTLKGVDYLSKDHHLRKIIIEDPAIFPTNRSKDLFSDINLESQRFVEKILIKGINEGRFNDLNTKKTAELLFSIYILIINMAYIDSKGTTFAKNIKSSMEILFNGIIKRD